MTLASAVIAALLSGGLLGAAVSVYTARRKVPAEVDSLIVTGAETAVSTLEKTLVAESRRADRAEAKVCSLNEVIALRDERIARLERRLDGLQDSLDAARTELHLIITNP